VHRVTDGPWLATTHLAIRESGRTPLIVSSFENPTTTQQVRENMGLLYPQLETYWHLRSLGMEMEASGYEIFQQFKQE